MDEKSIDLKRRISEILDAEDMIECSNEMILLGDEVLSGDYNKGALKEIRIQLDNEYAEKLSASGGSLIKLIAFLQLRVLLDPIPDMYVDFLELISRLSIDVVHIYFLWAQCRNMQFNMPSIISGETKKLFMMIYKNLIDEFEKRVGMDLQRIPLEERCENAVVIITSQFVSITHGPTKSCFFRAKALIQEEGRNVLIINTNDVIPEHGALPLFRMVSHGTVDELERANTVRDDDVRIPYFQCEFRMPDPGIIGVLLENIREIKPKFIINIGGYNITASLANKLVPVLCVGMGPSQLQYDYTDFFTYSVKPTEEVYKELESYGGSRDALIPSVFTSDLKEQSEEHTRKEYGIPEDKVVLGVIGGRLDMEVNEEFIDFIKSFTDETMKIVFMGTYNNYDKVCNRDEWFKEHTMYIGFVKDILSHMELCDIYLNPTRLGGGTSSVEAMSKGVVPVSLDYGDVAYNVGDEFVDKTYEDMADRIKRLVGDKDYYREMSDKAKARSKYLCDTKHRFIETIHELESRLK